MAFGAEVTDRALAGGKRHHIIVEQPGNLFQQRHAYTREPLAQADQNHQLHGTDLFAVQRLAH
ncbi:hypothetical protein D3C78_1957550 [compost metagenome]